MQPYKYIYVCIFLVLALSFYMGCSPKFRYKILSKVFDGVPDPSKETIDARDTLNLNDSTGIVTIESALKPQNTIHPPYKEKECGSCHDQNSMGKFIQPQPQLCFQCHNDFTEKHSFSHGPVVGGYCTSCHQPHVTESKKLLLRSGQQICFYCHDSKTVTSNQIHKEIKETNCTECHNPHGSDNRFMLQAGICNKCHGDFSETYSYVHGPVAGEYCATCHDAHLEKSEKLLLRSDKQLCLHCHNAKQVYQPEYHKNNEEKNCTECHNPHGGEDKYILN